MIVGVTLILTAAFALPLIARATGGASPVDATGRVAPVAAVVAAAATVVAVGVRWWLVVLIAVPTAFLIGRQVPPRRRPSRAGEGRARRQPTPRP